MIVVKDIHKSFDDNHVLKGVSTEFHKGKINMIIGRSGSGKTVFLKSMLGLHAVDSGHILFDERDITVMDYREKKELHKEMGMVFQGGALFDSMTIEENVMFPLNMFSDFSMKEKRDRVNTVLSRVNLEKVNHLLPAEVSGGMQKRVAIARAIVMSPKYLFCDEPNSGLDPNTAIVIYNLIQEITEEYNITTIINTHDMNSVMEIGENINLIQEGLLVWRGNKEEILSTDNPDVNDFVFSSRLFKKIREKS
jgi:phospholipid/cholesterol/gamma-HCH transport system ATP-binding protein